MRQHRGFTLIELLVVVAVITALLAILMPSVNRALETAKRARCAANLNQLGTATLAYAVTNFAMLPSSANPLDTHWGYRTLIRSEAGGLDPDTSDLFRCPARDSASSYPFNGLNSSDSPRTRGLSGSGIASIYATEQTILINEWCAYAPMSWHDPNPMTWQGSLHPVYQLDFWDKAPANIVFVDGHVAYTPMYFRTPGPTYLDSAPDWPIPGEWSYFYNPPSGYGYKWSPGPPPSQG